MVHKWGLDGRGGSILTIIFAKSTPWLDCTLVLEIRAKALSNFVPDPSFTTNVLLSSVLNMDLPNLPTVTSRRLLPGKLLRLCSTKQSCDQEWWPPCKWGRAGTTTCTVRVLCTASPWPTVTKSDYSSLVAQLALPRQYHGLLTRWPPDDRHPNAVNLSLWHREAPESRPHLL